MQVGYVKPQSIIYLYTGCRRSEALALRWGDIDLNNNCIHIAYQLSEKGTLEPLKTESSNRTVPLLPPLKKILEHLPQGDSGELIFSFMPQAVTKHLKKIFIKLNLHDINVHSLRHTYQTRLKEWNVPPNLRQKWLGHSKPETTQIYDHVLKEYETKETAKVIQSFDTKSDTKTDK